MIRTGIIFGIVLTLSGVQTARAEPACDTISAVMRTASLIRKVQADKTHRNDFENFTRLESLVGQISLPALVPPETGDVLADESAALRAYLSSIREAIAGSKSGYDDYARETLITGLNRDLARSLQSLDQHWGCGPDEELSQEDEDIPVDAAQGAGADEETVEDRREETVNLQAKNPGSGSGAETGGQSNGVGLARGALMDGGTTLFSLIMLGIALIALGFYLRRRAKNRTVREARSLLHKPVQVRFGTDQAEMFVVDISMNGFKLEHSGRILHEGKVQVELEGIWHAGHVRWQNDFFAGVKFNKPINSETLSAVVQ